MPVLLTQDLPVPIDVVHEVATAMGVVDDPPKGLIVHVGVARGDTTHVVDVWESREDYEQFAQTRLGPAIGKVMQARGLEMPDGPEPTIEDVGDFVPGR